MLGAIVADGHDGLVSAAAAAEGGGGSSWELLTDILPVHAAAKDAYLSHLSREPLAPLCFTTRCLDALRETALLLSSST